MRQRTEAGIPCRMHNCIPTQGRVALVQNPPPCVVIVLICDEMLAALRPHCAGKKIFSEEECLALQLSPALAAASRASVNVDVPAFGKGSAGIALDTEAGETTAGEGVVDTLTAPMCGAPRGGAAGPRAVKIARCGPQHND